MSDAMANMTGNEGFTWIGTNGSVAMWRSGTPSNPGGTYRLYRNGKLIYEGVDQQLAMRVYDRSTR